MKGFSFLFVTLIWSVILLQLVESQTKTSQIISLTDDNFDTLTKDGIWFIDVYAPWCGFCKQLHPILEQISKQIDSHSNVHIGMVNADENPKLDARFVTSGYPTLVTLHNGYTTPYNRPRTFEGISSYLRAMAQDVVQEVLSSDHIVQLTQQPSGWNSVFIYLGPAFNIAGNFQKCATKFQGRAVFASPLGLVSATRQAEGQTVYDHNGYEISKALESLTTAERQALDNLVEYFGIPDANLPAVVNVSPGRMASIFTTPFWPSHTPLCAWIESLLEPPLQQLTLFNYAQSMKEDVIALFGVTKFATTGNGGGLTDANAIDPHHHPVLQHLPSLWQQYFLNYPTVRWALQSTLVKSLDAYGIPITPSSPVAQFLVVVDHINNVFYYTEDISTPAAIQQFLTQTMDPQRSHQIARPLFTWTNPRKYTKFVGDLLQDITPFHYLCFALLGASAILGALIGVLYLYYTDDTQQQLEAIRKEKQLLISKHSQLAQTHEQAVSDRAETSGHENASSASKEKESGLRKRPQNRAS